MDKLIKKEELHNKFDKLVESLDNGEVRPQQLKLSEEIADCINKHENGIYQAGTRNTVRVLHILFQQLCLVEKYLCLLQLNNYHRR